MAKPRRRNTVDIKTPLFSLERKAKYKRRGKWHLRAARLVDPQRPQWKRQRVYKRKGLHFKRHGPVVWLHWGRSQRKSQDARWLRSAKWKESGALYDKTGQTRFRKGKVNYKAYASSGTLAVDINSWHNAVLIPVLYTVLNRIAQSMEKDAKKNAPWTDRTGRARAGLTGSVERDGKTMRLKLAHGSNIRYGKYLERGHQGIGGKRRILGRSFGKTYQLGKRLRVSIGRSNVYGKYQIVQPMMKKWTQRIWILLRKSLGEGNR